MSEKQILDFKPLARLEQASDHSPKQLKDTKHRLGSCADSTSMRESSRMGFSGTTTYDSSLDWVGGPKPGEQPSIYTHPDIRGSFAGQWWIR